MSFPAVLDARSLLKDGSTNQSNQFKSKQIISSKERNEDSEGISRGRFSRRPKSSDSKKTPKSRKMFQSKIVPMESNSKMSPKKHSKENSTTNLTPKIKKFLKSTDEDQSCFDQLNDSLLLSQQEGFVSDKLKEIVQSLSSRTEKAKDYVTQPPTPSTGASQKGNLEAPKPPPLKLIIATTAKEDDKDEVDQKAKGTLLERLYLSLKNKLLHSTIEPQSRLNICWLFIACSSYLYNAWMVPMRTIFSEYQTKENLHIWFTLDYICDVIYICDIIFFKIRVQFLKDGTWVTESQEIRKAYIKSHRFAIDLLSLLPLEIFYLVLGPVSALRFPRLLKISVFFEFFDRIDSVLSNPFLARLIRSIIFMVYTIHIYALIYYGFSKYEGIGSNSWVFQGEGNAYARCYFFAIKTATSIGKNPKPVNVKEQALMAGAWLSGVFVFAVLIGQVKDIVLTATKNQDEYRRLVDETINYLNKFNVPTSVIEKVRLWFSYTWKTQKTLDEIRALKFLPVKLQLDLAINVHIQTLSKVQLFQDCDENLLRDLVLKLKPVIYLPGDYVCKKGEVGKEMYIVKTGEVQVVGGPTGDTVFVTLSEGSVFGEISLLALAGGNRRTADVRSHGFSNLFVLSKEDLQSTIKDHPEAQEVLKKKASKLIKDTKERDKSATKKKVEEVNETKQLKKSPKLLNTVFKLAKRGSITDSIRIRSLNLKTLPSLTKATNHYEKFGSDSDEDDILTIEAESNLLKNSQTDKNKPPTVFIHSSHSNDSKFSGNRNMILKLEDDDDFEDFVEKPKDDFQTLRSGNTNFNFIPDDEQITYSLRNRKDESHSEINMENNIKMSKYEFNEKVNIEKLEDKTLCLQAEKLLRSLENLNDEKDQSNKRKGLIDLGESIESDDWTQNCLDSPKSFEFREMKKTNEELNLFESLSSSKESLVLFPSKSKNGNFLSDPESDKF